MESASSGHIVLTGFMGSGKSSVARVLAAKTGLTHLDTDDLVVRQADMSISDIFAKEGETGFRDREHEVLKALIGEKPCVISSGGGVVVREENRILLRQLGTVIYLEVTAEEALARIGHSEGRPLLRGALTPQQLLNQRQGWYEGVADVRVDTSSKSISQVASEIYHRLRALQVI